MPKSPPQVPRALQEMLGDYPEYIEELQKSLIHYTRRTRGPSAYDPALWALRDGLADFYVRAASELRAAEATGDAKAIEKAEQKAALMARAMSSNGGMRLVMMDEGFWNYFHEPVGTAK